MAILSAALTIPAATAQTFTTLYAFTGGLDGGGPWGTPLISGDIYETTFYGGSTATGEFGAVFEFFPNFKDGTYIYDFGGQPNDGWAPMGGLMTDGFGDFFGTTTTGGYGFDGTVYEISGGTEFPLWGFTGKDGKDPEGSLVMDPVGNLYGTTSGGGANGSGTVFALSSFGSLVQIYSFGNYKSDGIAPACSLVFLKGVLYGVTTEGGANGYGTIFSGEREAPKRESVLYSFQGKRKDGGTPVGGSWCWMARGIYMAQPR